MSFDSIYKKLASSIEPGAATEAFDPNFDPGRHISPVVAHELNNILAIIQGYADRLLLRHEKDATLEPHLKLISEAARRATTIVHAATPSNNHNSVIHPAHASSPPPAA
ncbi:MAG: hypothetical protein KGJ88_04720 [Verrucomicrobiota bacterium]|nr:hypothetical protein [Verrucomicrobiota bacterium]